MKINMKITAILTALLVLGAFSLFACQPAGYVSPDPVPSSEVITGPSGSYNGQVERYVDREAGVVCYFIIASYGVGIDCMPLLDTNLR